MTFGLVSFHLVDAEVVPTAGVPLLYAAAMAAGAVAALLTGEAYDRVGPRTLLALPVLVAAVPPLAFAGGLPAVTIGVLLWGAAVGLQDSTVKALVADLVRPDRRATAYGLFAAVQGVGALVGGIATGALYEQSARSLVIAVVASQVLAAVLLVAIARRPGQFVRAGNGGRCRPGLARTSVRSYGCLEASHGAAHRHPVDPERVAHARARGLSAEDAARLTSLLSLLADPMRARILYALDLVEELCVGDLALALGRTRTPSATRCACCARPGWWRRARRAGSSTTGWPPASPSRCSSTASAS